MANYWQRVAELGADDSPYRATFAQILCVAETDAEAERLYAPQVGSFFNRCLHVYPGFADAPGSIARSGPSMPQAGHMVTVEQPEAVAAALARLD